MYPASSMHFNIHAYFHFNYSCVCNRTLLVLLSIQWNLRTKATFGAGFLALVGRLRILYYRIGHFVPFSLAVVAIWSPLVRRIYCCCTSLGVEFLSFISLDPHFLSPSSLELPLCMGHPHPQAASFCKPGLFLIPQCLFILLWPSDSPLHWATISVKMI